MILTNENKSQSDAALLLLNTVVQTNQSSNRRCGRQQKLVLEFHSSRVTIGTYQMGRSIGLDRVGQPLMESHNRLFKLSQTVYGGDSTFPKG